MLQTIGNVCREEPCIRIRQEVVNGVGINTTQATSLNSTTTLGTNVSKTVIGTTLNMTGTTINTLFGNQTQLQTILIVTGRDSGARVTILKSGEALG